MIGKEYRRTLQISRKATQLQIAIANPTYPRPSDPVPPSVEDLCDAIIIETRTLREEWEKSATSSARLWVEKGKKNHE